MKAVKDTATAAQVTVGLDSGERHIRVCALDESGQACEEVRIVTP